MLAACMFHSFALQYGHTSFGCSGAPRLINSFLTLDVAKDLKIPRKNPISPSSPWSRCSQGSEMYKTSVLHCEKLFPDVLEKRVLYTKWPGMWTRLNSPSFLHPEQYMRSLPRALQLPSTIWLPLEWRSRIILGARVLQNSFQRTRLARSSSHLHVQERATINLGFQFKWLKTKKITSSLRCPLVQTQAAECTQRYCFVICILRLKHQVIVSFSVMPANFSDACDHKKKTTIKYSTRNCCDDKTNSPYLCTYTHREIIYQYHKA